MPMTFLLSLSPYLAQLSILLIALVVSSIALASSNYLKLTNDTKVRLQSLVFAFSMVLPINILYNILNVHGVRLKWIDAIFQNRNNNFTIICFAIVISPFILGAILHFVKYIKAILPRVKYTITNTKHYYTLRFKQLLNYGLKFFINYVPAILSKPCLILGRKIIPHFESNVLHAVFSNLVKNSPDLRAAKKLKFFNLLASCDFNCLEIHEAEESDAIYWLLLEYLKEKKFDSNAPILSQKNLLIYLIVSHQYYKAQLLLSHPEFFMSSYTVTEAAFIFLKQMRSPLWPGEETRFKLILKLFCVKTNIHSMHENDGNFLHVFLMKTPNRVLSIEAFDSYIKHFFEKGINKAALTKAGSHYLDCLTYNDSEIFNLNTYQMILDECKENLNINLEKTMERLICKVEALYGNISASGRPKFHFDKLYSCLDTLIDCWPIEYKINNIKLIKLIIESSILISEQKYSLIYKLVDSKRVLSEQFLTSILHFYTYNALMPTHTSALINLGVESVRRGLTSFNSEDHFICIRDLRLNTRQCLQLLETFYKGDAPFTKGDFTNNLIALERIAYDHSKDYNTWLDISLDSLDSFNIPTAKKIFFDFLRHEGLIKIYPHIIEKVVDKFISLCTDSNNKTNLRDNQHHCLAYLFKNPEFNESHIFDKIFLKLFLADPSFDFTNCYSYLRDIRSIHVSRFAESIILLNALISNNLSSNMIYKLDILSEHEYHCKYPKVDLVSTEFLITKNNILKTFKDIFQNGKKIKHKKQIKNQFNEIIKFFNQSEINHILGLKLFNGKSLLELPFFLKASKFSNILSFHIKEKSWMVLHSLFIHKTSVEEHHSNTKSCWVEIFKNVDSLTEWLAAFINDEAFLKELCKFAYDVDTDETVKEMNVSFSVNLAHAMKRLDFYFKGGLTVEGKKQLLVSLIDASQQNGPYQEQDNYLIIQGMLKGKYISLKKGNANEVTNPKNLTTKDKTKDKKEKLTLTVEEHLVKHEILNLYALRLKNIDNKNAVEPCIERAKNGLAYEPIKKSL